MHPSVCSSLAKNLSIACCAVTLMAAPAASAAGGAPKAYRFTASATNTTNSVMTLDHAALNGKKNLQLIVTQYFTGVYNPHPVGVAYNAVSNKWQIFNEDNAAIPVNANFNVMIAPTAKRVDVEPANSHGILAFFPTQKNNPNAKLLATHLINPDLRLNGVKQPNNVSLYYNPPTQTPTLYGGRWSIYQANTESNIAATYNIADVTNLKIGGQVVSFRHNAVDANTTNLETTITNPLSDAKPNAVLFIQHVFTPTAAANVDEVLGVRYSDGKWKIFTEDQTDKLAPVDFNVVVFPAVSP